jgi:hypothetical protein
MKMLPSEVVKFNVKLDLFLKSAVEMWALLLSRPFDLLFVSQIQNVNALLSKVGLLFVDQNQNVKSLDNRIMSEMQAPLALAKLNENFLLVLRAVLLKLLVRNVVILKITVGAAASVIYLSVSVTHFNNAR